MVQKALAQTSITTMTGFLPDYSMHGTQNAKRRENVQRQKTLQGASTDPRLSGALQTVAGASAEELGGAELDPVAKFQAGQAMSQEAQMQQARFQGALRQAASGQGGQQQEPMLPQDPRNVAGWTKFVRGGPKYLNQFLPQY